MKILVLFLIYVEKQFDSWYIKYCISSKIARDTL